MKKLILLTFALFSAQAMANIIYSTGFRTVDDGSWSDTTAWSDGSTTSAVPFANSIVNAGGRLNDSSDWVATGSWGMEETGTSGKAGLYNNWQRAAYGIGQSFGIGETISLSLDIAYNASHTSNNREFFDLGLSSGSTLSLGSTNALGVLYGVGLQLQVDIDGKWEFETADESIQNFNPGFNAAAGSFVTVNLDITKSATEDQFDLVGSIVGGTTPFAFSLNSELLYDASDVFVQVVGQAHVENLGGVQVDNFSFSAVPEPSTFMLFGVGAVIILRSRRRS